MRYGDAFTGISAATVACHPLGWTPVWFSEIAPFPCRVLSYWYPDVTNLGDITRIHEQQLFIDAPIDLLAGGSPCQDFSGAGLRRGLAGSHGKMALGFCRILTAKRPAWFLWENVPGVLSSFSDETPDHPHKREGPRFGENICQSSDFAALLNLFRQCGYSCAWRVLDAQYFGVPQHRRRLYVVGYLGKDWRAPAAVLFEHQGLCWDPPAGKEKTQEIASTIITRPYSDNGDVMNLVPWPAEITATLDASFSKKYGQNDQHVHQGASLFVPHIARPLVSHAARQDGMNENFIISFAAGNSSTAGLSCSETVTPTLKSASAAINQAPSILQQQNGASTVRRLTPLECERLQGFPDNYTAIPGAKDSPRYEAIGNSMPVPVIAWICRRIDYVDKQLKK